MSKIKYKEITLQEEVSGCLLCHEAACTKACPSGIPVDKIIRSYRFENINGAKKFNSRKSTMHGLQRKKLHGVLP